MKNQLFSTILISLLISLIVVGVYHVSTQKNSFETFYTVETDVLVSPHGLRKKMMAGGNDFILVDVRSQQEYEEEHIVGAVNIPAYKDPDTSAYGDVERITNSFRELIDQNPNKDIIVYCYSTPCMTGRKVGKMLADRGMYVKELGIGWNEWRYDWNAWNHPHEWDITSVEDYVVSGREPGVFSGATTSNACPVTNDLGC